MKKLDNAFYTGKLSKACKQCHKGQELVLFVTGKCLKNCFYCPISNERAGEDDVYANERKVNKEKDVIQEAKEIQAKGAGVTGGEPLIVLDRVVKYLRLLKNEFGKDFYVHLYTAVDEIQEEQVQRLEEAGLDEIRFHAFRNFERARPAISSSIRTGFEVPCIPGKEKELKQLIDFAENKGCFVNLNEFEFSDTNFQELRDRGFKHPENSFAVDGSKELGKKLVAYSDKKDVDVHFCPLSVKYSAQLNNRNKRRAEQKKKPWEKVNEFGMLVKGVAEVSEETARSKDVHWNDEMQWAETTVSKARELGEKYGTSAWQVVVYPTHDEWVFEKDPL